MWVPKAVVDWFHIAKDSVSNLREELAAVRTERDVLKSQLTITQNQFDWLRMRVNSLEMERAQLFEKAYGIKIPAPEIVRQVAQPPDLNPSIFEDVGEDLAKQLGLPVYNN